MLLDIYFQLQEMIWWNIKLGKFLRKFGETETKCIPDSELFPWWFVEGSLGKELEAMNSQWEMDRIVAMSEELSQIESEYPR